MQNIKTLIDLGFIRHKKWDGEVTESYRKEHNGKIFSAHECGSSMGFPNEKTFISIGEVIKEEKGIVKYWADCCSEGSVERFINKDTDPRAKEF